MRNRTEHRILHEVPPLTMPALICTCLPSKRQLTYDLPRGYDAEESAYLLSYEHCTFLGSKPILLVSSFRFAL